MNNGKIVRSVVPVVQTRVVQNALESLAFEDALEHVSHKLVFEACIVSVVPACTNIDPALVVEVARFFKYKI